jgi:pimeloyl-ACP methyl ester carboxylesterase
VSGRGKILRLAGLGFIVIVVTFVVLAALWLQPFPAAAAAERAMQSSDAITVTESDGVIAFMPSEAPRTGFIFYPGARVEPTAYAAHLRAVAEQGYAVFVVRMPLNMAFLGSGRAAAVMAAHQDITAWAIGGHSLGGAMAAGFAAGNADIGGLVLWASYPDRDMSARDDLPIASIYGTRDGLATPEKIDDSRRLLPAGTVFVAVEGGNHAQFGDYGPQEGDLEPMISDESARLQIVTATVALLSRVGR